MSQEGVAKLMITFMKTINKLILVAALLLTTLMAKAQFTIVDADSKETLLGVYVYSETGKLLAMSDENGMVKALDAL